MLRYLYSFIFLICLLSGPNLHANCLKDRFLQSEPGDYIISEQNKSLSLLRIHSIQNQTVMLEELSLPAKLAPYETAKLEKWLKSGAPGHTSWHLLEIDLEQGQILECYSFTRNAWLVLSENDSFFTKINE